MVYNIHMLFQVLQDRVDSLQRQIQDLETKTQSLQLTIDRLSLALAKSEEEESTVKDKVLLNFLSTRIHSIRMRTVRCSGRLSCHARPPRHAWPLPCMPLTTMHTHPPTPAREQNDRHLWKHNLAATTLGTVNMGKGFHVVPHVSHILHVFVWA